MLQNLSCLANWRLSFCRAVKFWDWLILPSFLVLVLVHFLQIRYPSALLLIIWDRLQDLIMTTQKYTQVGWEVRLLWKRLANSSTSGRHLELTLFRFRFVLSSHNAVPAYLIHSNEVTCITSLTSQETSSYSLLYSLCPLITMSDIIGHSMRQARGSCWSQQGCCSCQGNLWCLTLPHRSAWYLCLLVASAECCLFAAGRVCLVQAG